MNTTLEQQLFDQIFKQFSSNNLAIAEISKLLGVARTSVYSRANGTVPLTVTEFKKLTSHFNIPPMEFFSIESKQLLFDYRPLKGTSKNQDEFLENITKNLLSVAQNPTGRIQYLSANLPFFYYFFHEEIAWFKRYLYQHNQSAKVTSKLPKISFKDIQNKHRIAFSKVIQLYVQVPSEEIWTSQALNSTIAEIKYFLQMDLFEDRNDALLLMDKLMSLVKVLHLMVRDDDKGILLNPPMERESIDLYFNDFNRFNSTIIARTRKSSTLYITYDLPNYLYSTSKGINTYTHQWIDRVKKKSYRLSGGNAHLDQLNYFNHLKQFLKSEKRVIKKMISK